MHYCLKPTPRKFGNVINFMRKEDYTVCTVKNSLISMDTRLWALNTRRRKKHCLQNEKYKLSYTRNNNIVYLTDVYDGIVHFFFLKLISLTPLIDRQLVLRVLVTSWLPFTHFD